MKHRLIIILLLLSARLTANDSTLISRLLQRVYDLQPKESGVFPKGSIPSYRLYALNKTRYKADINSFFTGLVVFTLQDIQSGLSPAQQQQANAIIADASPVYQKFRNRKNGRNTYNFWPTDTPQIFPHSGWLNWFDQSQSLPDDFDDTVIMLLAQRESDSVAKAVHALMQEYTNNDAKRIQNTFPEFRHIGAYSTWFGKKMPVDFDVCVLSNILYFVQWYHLPWTAADSASLYLIENTIATRKYDRSASYISPHYATTPLILYHISRLMSVKPIPALEKLKPQLIEDAKKALSSAGTFMDEVILSTALLRWGVAPPDVQPHHAGSLQELVEDERFSFFIANMASMLPNPLKQWMGSTGAGRFYYYCPAYNNLLLVENLVWRKKRGLG
jgi:hypothetical protein